LFKRIFHHLFRLRETSPELAYDLWACGYDYQPGNLMLDLDEVVFSTLLNETVIGDKTVTDIGCGTGRHWKKIMDKKPRLLTGYDVSEGMMQQLKRKFPGAITHKMKDEKLEETIDHSVDLIISTLALAHIEKLESAIWEWDRILKPGGHVIVTDYHPTALLRGGKRTFRHGGKRIAVKNHIHPIEKLRTVAGQLHWQPLRLVEKVIDESVKPYYERQNALDVFRSFHGVPVIYGILFKKNDAS
jgi:ubiquinone/menaquinone biosynthesis C-methylase UbiE